ncbi:hypothetical protein CJU90_3361 [Yarrowia sp. C11]|nr:hypothetical protein CKK34_4807 [Yarrowia sp. E02]KAG5369824.1 hypothetical protein CJU90_3361 [Yarrowia sp. C11]
MTTHSPSVLQEQDIDRLINAQKKPEPTMKDKVLLFEKKKKAEKEKREKEKEGEGGKQKENPFLAGVFKGEEKEKTMPKSAMKSTVQGTAAAQNTAHTTTKTQPPASSVLGSPSMASFMSGNTSAAIDCLMNGTTSTPHGNVPEVASTQPITSTQPAHPPAANSSNSFDSHTTQKAGSFNPNITHILSERESTDCYADSEPRFRAHKPSVLLPTTVLTDNKTPTFPPSPDFFSDHSEARDVRVGASFDTQKQYSFARPHGSDVSSAVEGACRQASETRRANLESYREKSRPAPHSHLRTASSYMEKIRTEVDKEQTREKKLARERLARKRDKFDVLQTPMAKSKMNMQVPLDMSEEQLFEVICKLTTQLDKSQARVKELDEYAEQCSEQLNEQQEEIEQLKSLQEEEKKEKEEAVSQLKEQLQRSMEQREVELRHVTESKDKELLHVSESKDLEIQQLRQQVQELSTQLQSSTVADMRTLRTDYEHYKSQCYRKDVVISELEAQLKREQSLEELETELREKEKRLIKTELRLGQQALEQDHERQKLEVEKKVLGEKDEEERLRERLREMGKKNGRRSSREERSSRSRDRSSRSRDRSSRSRDRYRSRDLSPSRSPSRYRRRSGSSVKDYSVGSRKGDLRSLALEKIIDFLLNRQKAGAQRAHMDACYNLSGPGERYSDGLNDATVEKVLKEFLSKDETYLQDLLQGDGKRLEEYLGTIYCGVQV